MRRIILVMVIIVSLLLGACETSAPLIYHSEAGLEACGISGFDHNENGTSTADANLVAGSLNAVRAGGCNGGEVFATLYSVTTMVYLYDGPGPAEVWTCSHPHQSGPTANASSLLNVVGNEFCPVMIPNPPSGPYPATGWYASVSNYTAWFFGTPHGSGPFPHPSPWEWVDLCDCGFFPESIASFGPPSFEAVMEANDGRVLVAGPESDLSDPETAVDVIHVSELAG